MGRFITQIAIAMAIGSGPSWGDEIVVDFVQQAYRFRVEGAVVEERILTPEGENLRAIVTPGSLDRPSLDYVGLFELVGDFEVSIAYDIGSLPRPEPPDANAEDYAYSNNIQLTIAEPGRRAIVYRNHRRGGQGIGYLFTRDKSTTSDHQPVVASSGRIGMRRVGGALTMVHGQGVGPLKELATVAWGAAPVYMPTLSILPLRTRDGIDVSFRQYRIKADSIEWSPTASRSARRNDWLWLRVLALPAILSALVMYRTWIERSGLADADWTGDPGRAILRVE